MEQPSIDYGQALVSVGPGTEPPALGAALLQAVGERYEREHGGAYLHEFEQAGAVYLFDLASAGGLPQEDRTVAAWAVTPEARGGRDASYQRGFPMTPAGLSPVDRGHLIPHMSGGEFGPNIFRQDRGLNRGWSEQGKRYRAMEREASVPGSFFFGHLLYTDDSAWPSGIELAVLRGVALHVERFDNRPAG